jgi:hypothetical protein
MTHPIYRIMDFEIVGEYTLRIEFDDATEQVIDFQPILEGALYGPLQDLVLFNQVEIDPEVHTLVWPNGADFDPATLHDWSRYEEDMFEHDQELLSALIIKRNYIRKLEHLQTNSSGSTAYDRKGEKQPKTAQNKN